MDYKFKINDFEGPLDLLLHLIRKMGFIWLQSIILMIQTFIW